MRLANMDRILMPQKMNSLMLPFGNTYALKTLAVRKTRSSLLCAITNAPQVIMSVLLWIPLQPALLNSRFRVVQRFCGMHQSQKPKLEFLEQAMSLMMGTTSPVTTPRTW
jgi:hypothetical protein